MRPIRLSDLALGTPMTGIDAQVFDAGLGPQIFTGSEIYDIRGVLSHTIDPVALGITDALAGGAVISGNRFVVDDGDTSTVIVFTVP